MFFFMAIWLDLWTLTSWLKQDGFAEWDPQQVINLQTGQQPSAVAWEGDYHSNWCILSSTLTAYWVASYFNFLGSQRGFPLNSQAVKLLQRGQLQPWHCQGTIHVVT